MIVAFHLINDNFYLKWHFLNTASTYLQFQLCRLLFNSIISKKKGKSAPKGKKNNKKNRKDGPDSCMSSWMNDGYFEDHLFSGILLTLHSKKEKKRKVWNNGTDLCGWDPYTFCSQDQRVLLITSERIKNSISLLLLPQRCFMWSNCVQWLVCLAV